MFGARPDGSKEYNFDQSVAGLPFAFNVVDVPLTKEQENGLVNLAYDNQQYISLHDEDFGHCGKLAHTISTIHIILFICHIVWYCANHNEKFEIHRYADKAMYNLTMQNSLWLTGYWCRKMVNLTLCWLPKIKLYYGNWCLPLAPYWQGIANFTYLPMVFIIQLGTRLFTDANDRGRFQENDILGRIVRII